MTEKIIKDDVITETVVEKKEPSVIDRLVPAHNIKSRSVTEYDLDRVTEESKILHEICFTPFGNFSGAYAMHHSQIDNKDPMNFFVKADRKIIINPVITRHSNYTTDSKEACMSFGNKEQIIVPRWHKCEVEYVTITLDKEGKFGLSSPIQEKLSGHESFILQHEVDHGNAQFIYPLEK